MPFAPRHSAHWLHVSAVPPPPHRDVAEVTSLANLSGLLAAPLEPRHRWAGKNPPAQPPVKRQAHALTDRAATPAPGVAFWHYTAAWLPPQYLRGMPTLPPIGSALWTSPAHALALSYLLLPVRCR